MPKRRHRVLIVCTHPVQYASPLFRQMAQHPRLDIQVAYCSLQGAEAGLDREFGVEVQWDVPLLDGYPWVEVPNQSPWPRLGHFFGLMNPGLWKLVRTGNYDVVFTYTGYAYLSFWIAALAAKLARVPLVSSTDAYNLGGAIPRPWKSLLKRVCLPFIYRVYDAVLAPSDATVRFVESLGMPRKRIMFAPGGFDGEWWARESARSDKRRTRARWGIPDSSPVLLFCAKLQPWKRPLDLLRAFARLGQCDGFLVFAGEGPLRAALEAEAKALGVTQRVVFLGFVNQTQLPELYGAADVFVLPSAYDGAPLVVCEAMSCGCPVVLSDAIPGRLELVRHDDTGFVYPCGNVDALASVLRQALQDPEQLKRISLSAAERMKAWSVGTYADGLVRAFEQVAPMTSGLAHEQAA
jgi:glycosyltransferase involved in cell wall biosynthesis